MQHLTQSAKTMLETLVDKGLENENTDISMSSDGEMLVRQSRDRSEILENLGITDSVTMMIKQNDPRKAAFFMFVFEPGADAAAVLADHSQGEYSDYLLKAIEPLIEESVF